MGTRHVTSLVAALLLVAGIAGPADASTLTLRWSGLTSPVHPGAFATATVATTVGASCGIVVKYSSTISHAAGLVSKKAPAGGRLAWKWKVGTSTHPGSWRVTVTSKLGSKTLAIWRTMSVK